MQRPHLIIVAGCNGAGKSTYSHTLVDDIIPFDYDKQFLETYNSMRDSELREEIAHNQTAQKLNHLIDNAFQNKTSVCFETNLHNFPHEWIETARKLNYIIDLYFFCLENVEIAKTRVDIRTKNQGHFVPNDVIDFKWKEGYKNLNLHFGKFDFVCFIDNSTEDIPEIMFELHKESDTEHSILIEKLPGYAKTRFPAIFDLIN